jgi:hypothetical protein
MHQVLVEPGAAQPRTCKLRLLPHSALQIGHAFRETGSRPEVIATVENLTAEVREVEIDLVNDYRVEMTRGRKAEGVRLTEHFAGGNQIVDNFNDTGRIDREPEGLLRDIVLGNVADWMVG